MSSPAAFVPTTAPPCNRTPRSPSSRPLPRRLRATTPLRTRPPLRLAPHRPRTSLHATAPTRSSVEDALAAWDAAALSRAVISDARHLPGFLRDFWAAVCHLVDTAGDDVAAGDPDGLLVVAPYCAALHADGGAAWARLMGYIGACADGCEELGAAVRVGACEGAPFPAVRLSRGAAGAGVDGLVEDEDEDWPDSAADLFAKYGIAVDNEPDSAAPTAEDGSAEVEDGVVIDDTKRWVQAVIVELGICPFTSSSHERAGIPAGPVRYAVSHAKTQEALYHDYWAEVCLVVDSGERELSTTLLMVPEDVAASADAFDAFSETLMMAMEPLGVENDIQLVVFHPSYSFRDGGERRGSQEEANFARRSPWPMLNILRTPQVRTAQRAIPTGLVYQQNEMLMRSVGVDKLREMLKERDWSGIEDLAPVDRRQSPVFEAARKLKEDNEGPSSQ